MYIYIVCRICTTRSVHRKCLWTQLIKGNDRLGKIVMDTLHSSVKKTAAGLKNKGKKLYTHATRCGKTSYYSL